MVAGGNIPAAGPVGSDNHTKQGAAIRAPVDPLTPKGLRNGATIGGEPANPTAWG